MSKTKRIYDEGFKAHITTTSIVFLRYMMIDESVRLQHDNRPWGNYFSDFVAKSKILDICKQ